MHRSVGTRLVSSVSDFGMDIVRAQPGGASAAVAAYERDPSVAFAEISVKRPFQLTPNDTHYANGNLWGLNNTGQSHVASSGANVVGTSGADIDAPQAWDTQTGSASTVVAVIDTGVQLTHPDLVNRLWTNTGETPSNGMDDDGNGYVDDVNGFDFGDLDGNPTQTNATCDSTGCPAHGTHVAGTVGAQMNNGQGVAGVCPDCRIMAIKVTTGTTSNFTTTARLIQAYAYVADNGADIVNGSYGGPIWSEAERAALKAAGTDGVLFAFAAANSALDNDVSACRGGLNCAPAYPASYNLGTIVSTAASNDLDRYGYFSNCTPIPNCAFSNWGHDSVDVAAPGVDIISTRPGSAYFTIDGTSMASPHVAGALGLIKSEHPAYTPAELKNALMNSVDHPASLRLFANVGVSVPANGIEAISPHPGTDRRERRADGRDDERNPGDRRDAGNGQVPRDEQVEQPRLARGPERLLQEEPHEGREVQGDVDRPEWEELRRLSVEAGRDRDMVVDHGLLRPRRSGVSARECFDLGGRRSRRGIHVQAGQERGVLHPRHGLLLGRQLHGQDRQGLTGSHALR